MLSFIVIFIYGWLTGIILSILGHLYRFDAFLVVMNFSEAIFSLLPFYKLIMLWTVETHHKAVATGADAVEGVLTGFRKVDRVLTGSFQDGPEAFAHDAACVASHYMYDCVVGESVECYLALRDNAILVYEVHDTAWLHRSLSVGDSKHKAGVSSASEQNGIQSEERISMTLLPKHYYGSIRIDRLETRLLRGDSKSRRAAHGFSGRWAVLLCARDDRPLLDSGDSSGDGTTPQEEAQGVGRAFGLSASGRRQRGGGGGDAMSSQVSSSTTRSRSGQASPVTTAPAGSRGAFNHAKFDRWTAMTIRFKDDREAEWWCSMLQGPQEGRAWWNFAQSLSTQNTANMLLSRLFFQSMRREGMSAMIKKLIQSKLDKLAQTKFPRDLQGHIYIDDFIIGKHIPSIGDVSDVRNGANGEIGFDMNLRYKGGEEGFSLYFRLALTYRGIRIPHVVFSVKLHHLEASLYVNVSPPPSKRFWIGCHVPPALWVEVHQGCASGKGFLHRILTTLPSLSALVTNLLKCYFFTEMVLPFLDDFPLPSLDKTPPLSPQQVTKKGRDFDRLRAAELSGKAVRLAEGEAKEPILAT